MAIRKLNADDVPLYRTIRLRALKADASAFGSTYEREAVFDEDTWTARLTSYAGEQAAVFICEIGGRAVAVGGIGITAKDFTAEIWGMWVEPEARRLGLASELVDKAIDWATNHNVSMVNLSVVRTNYPAVKFYESCGFVKRGSVIDAVDSQSSEELEMAYCISA